MTTATQPLPYEALITPDPGAHAGEPGWRGTERAEAVEWLRQHPMPTRRDEPWHYLPMDRISQVLDAAVRAPAPAPFDAERVGVLAGEHGGTRIVFVNGVFDAAASRLSPTDGTSVTPFSALGDAAPAVGSLTSERLDGIVALNAAAAADGASISISAGTSAPVVHVVHVTAPDPDRTLAVHPAARIHLAPDATATVIESFVGDDGAAAVIAATDIVLDDRATLTYHRVQSEGRGALHLGQVTARVATAATLRTVSVSLGGDLARAAFDVAICGDDATVALDGLYAPTREQHHDHTLTIEHAASHTTSTQRFRGVLDDRGRGSFTGHILVNPDTTGTTAHQANDNILLSSRAEADTRPWLEILADDVRCTHGATVGRLDDDAVFYLRSRGIPEDTARAMLIEGFASDVIDAIEPESLRHHVAAQLGHGAGIR